MSNWPKQLPSLSSEEKKICDEFMEDWHKKMGGSLRILDHFNHSFVVKNSPLGWQRTLDLGSGLGEHLLFEKNSPIQVRNYQMVEMRHNMAESTRRRIPGAQVLVADCQKQLPFPDQYFDRILAIHVLEHLPRLPECLQEVKRLLQSPNGKFLVVIPCEGGILYSLGRRCSAQRNFEKRYGLPYQLFIKREHINSVEEILTEIKKEFLIQKRSFFPLGLPLVDANLFIGLACCARPNPRF